MKTMMDRDRTEMDLRYKMTKVRLRHLLMTLNEDEFLDLLEGVYHTLGGERGVPKVAKPSNLFPTMKDKPFSIERSLLASIFPLGGEGDSDTSITKSLLGGDKLMHVAFLDWLTLAMAQSGFRNASSPTLKISPTMLYLRPREMWSKAPREDTARVPTLLKKTLRKMQSKTQPFSRTFQWHLFPSPTIIDLETGESPLVLLAVVTSWNRSITTTPIVWGYWTYLITRRVEEGVDTTHRLSYRSFDEYAKERGAMETETRLRAFDLFGMYRRNHFMVKVEAYNHLSMGQFISLLSSAEDESFDPLRVDLSYGGFYSPYVLDVYVNQYLAYLLPNTVSEDDSEAIRCFLLTLEPLMSLSGDTLDPRGDVKTILRVEDILP